MNKKPKSLLYRFGKIKQTAENEFLAVFYIDPKHDVFKGHFPQQPLLPGVIMVDIVRKCLEKIEGTSFKMDTAANIKFLHFLNPNDKHYSLAIKIKNADEKRMIVARIFQDKLVYFKQNASYIRK